MKPGTNALNRAFALKPLKLALAACTVLAAVSVHAASTSWTALGPDFNWSTAANWSNGVPAITSDVYFTTNTADLPNNIVNSETTVQSLWLQNTNTGAAFWMQINPGVTLHILNTNAGGSVYVLNAGGAYVPVMQLSSYISGAGAAMDIMATNGIFSVRQSQSTTSGSGSLMTLDMWDLDNLQANLSRLLVSGDGGYRAAGTLKLAKTNVLYLNYTAGPPMLLGSVGTGANGGMLYLGMTNAFFADVGVWVGYSRAAAAGIQFNPSAMGGSAYFRNRLGNGRMSYFRIGDGSSVTYSGNAANGTVDFTTGTVDAMVSDLVVARNMSSAGAPSAGVAGSVGQLSFNSGVIDATRVTIGYQNVNYGPRVEGTINVDGTGQLLVGESMTLGRFMTKTNTAAGNSFAKLNIGTVSGGGSVVVKGPITTYPGTDRQSEINIRGGGSLFARNSVGPLEYLELNDGNLTVELDANPTAPVIVTSNLLTSGSIKFALRVQGPGIEKGKITLIKYDIQYAGSVNPLDDLTLSLPAYLQGFLSNNTANPSIDLWITNQQVSVWNGDKSDNWDIAGTLNWKDGTTGTAMKFNTGDLVRFDDTAAGSGNVNLTAAVAPGQTTVNNTSKAYTFSGTGSLTGVGGIVKSGDGSLTLSNTGVNDFTGPVTIRTGTLKLGTSDVLPIGSTVSLGNTSGASLDLDGKNQALSTLIGGGSTGGEVKLGTGTLTLKSTSAYDGLISGGGTVVKSGSGTLTLTGPNTYTGGTMIESNSTVVAANASGSAVGTGSIRVHPGATLQIGSGSSGGSVGSGVITNDGRLVWNLPDSITFANLITGSGSVTKSGANTVTLDSANDFTGTLALNAGALRVTHPQALGAATNPDYEYSTAISSDATVRLELANNVTLNEVIQIASKSGTYLLNPAILSVSGTNTLGQLVLTVGGSVHHLSVAADSKLIVNGPIVPSTNLASAFPYTALSGDGEGVLNAGIPNGMNFNKMTNSLFKSGNGTWTLNGENTYLGHTVISNGTLVVNGSILGTNTVRIAAGYFIACLVRQPATLKGDGTIFCAVTNAGTFSPGSAIGTMTISNQFVMEPGSTNVFEIGSGTYDKVVGLSSVMYGGTLKVKLTGPLSGGEVFTLFSASTYDPSTFDTFELPDIAPLSWDTSRLNVDGTLRVSGGGINFAQFGLSSDGNFGMSGASGLGNSSYRVLGTTNIADSTSWVQVGTGTFDNGAFSFVDRSSTNYARRFYRLISP